MFKWLLNYTELYKNEYLYHLIFLGNIDWLIDWLLDWCLTPTLQYFSDIVACLGNIRILKNKNNINDYSLQSSYVTKQSNVLANVWLYMSFNISSDKSCKNRKNYPYTY
jgi:hypothetical protein